MHRIQSLVTLPASLELLARELESQGHSGDAQVLVIADALRFHATALAENIEACRLITDGHNLDRRGDGAKPLNGTTFTVRAALQWVRSCLALTSVGRSTSPRAKRLKSKDSLVSVSSSLRQLESSCAADIASQITRVDQVARPTWTEGMMKSDFTTARYLLAKASIAISGDDDTSRRCRRAIEMLVEALAKAEQQRPTAEILPFPRSGRRVR